MGLGTLQCTLGSGSYTSIEIVTAGHYNQSSDISGVFFSLILRKKRDK